MAAPTTLITCRGNYVLPIQDPATGDWGVVDCPGCNDCNREKVRARLDHTAAARRLAAVFAACDDDPFGE